MSHSEGAEVTSTTSLDSHTLEVLSERRLEDLKVEELKKICRARGLAVSGTKAQLLNRLQGKPGGASTPPPEGAASLSSMRTDDLKEACRQVGSPVSGTKEQLDAGPRGRPELAVSSKSVCALSCGASGDSHLRLLLECRIQASLLVRYRVEQVAIRISDFF
nr:putative DNA-binding transcription factor [Dunaliella parva]